MHRSTANGCAVNWTIDDIDPYRTFGGVEEAVRLAPEEFDRWCRELDDAWAVLLEGHVEHAPEISAVDPVIVPASAESGLVASSSSLAFGGVCVAPPESSEELAETLIHEIQHSKLNALLDLVPLRRPDADRLCYAPWREDPRPLVGLLHGIYAFVCVVEYWRRRLRSRPDPHEPATSFRFAYRREQMTEALRWLGAAPELTAAGAKFLEVASARLAACADVEVAEPLRGLVTTLNVESRLTWQLRHLVPPAEHVARLADRWLAGARRAASRVDSTVVPFHRPAARSSLSRLLKARALLMPDPEHLNAGERDLAGGDLTAAKVAFAARIRTDPDDDGAWVGLLLAMRQDRSEAPPAELAAATYRRINAVSSTCPDPVTVVDWFADLV